MTWKNRNLQTMELTKKSVLRVQIFRINEQVLNIGMPSDPTSNETYDADDLNQKYVFIKKQTTYLSRNSQGNQRE